WAVLLAFGARVCTAMRGDAGPWPGGGGAGHGGHLSPGGGPRFSVGAAPGGPAPWGYSPPAPVIVESPPPVIVQSAPVYVAPPPAPQYWYFCQSFNAYYPQTPTCPEPWLQVPARSY